MSKVVRRQLEMEVVTARDFDGIEMGVLADGTAFLSGRGLAAVCGVAPSVINEWANEYNPDAVTGRDATLTRNLSANNFGADSLFIKTKVDGREINAYSEAACMSFIEYYAFDAERKNDTALRNYRTLARAGLRAFIYSNLGYKAPDAFRSYYERLLLNKVPSGLFSCFAETSHVVLASIQGGLIVDQHTVPDISVGRIWSGYWNDNSLSAKYGERKKHPHIYPDDYPQSAAAPDAFVYPIEALGEFRKWLDTEYLPKNYPGYLQRKVRSGALPASRAELLIATLVPERLGAGSDDDE